MTPKEKAKKLISINSLAILSVVGNRLTMDEVKEIAKQCTIIAVDEIYMNNTDSSKNDYWIEVKQEIEQSK